MTLQTTANSCEFIFLDNEIDKKSQLVVPQRLDKWRKMWYNYENNSIMVNYTCFLTTIKYLALLLPSTK